MATWRFVICLGSGFVLIMDVSDGWFLGAMVWA